MALNLLNCSFIPPFSTLLCSWVLWGCRRNRHHLRRAFLLVFGHTVSGDRRQGLPCVLQPREDSLVAPP
jgi:hypothetical protein